MKTQNHTNSSYMIHSFMLENLGLRGSELTIFAIIHSFSKGEKGLYYGTNQFLAEASGLSISTVKRALFRLLSKGYIEELTSREHRCYRCTEAVTAPRVDAEELPEVDTEPMPSNEAEEEIPSINEINERGLDVRELLSDPDVCPKYQFHSVSKEGLVQMTAEQYKRLSSLVSDDKLTAYIRRLESLIKNSGYRTHSAYKTIKRWVLEDSDSS